MNENIQKYYDNTQSNEPRKNVKYFVEKIKCKPGDAVELGCGAGNDTIYLIRHNWKVLSIDKENVEERIAKRLNEDELKNFKFENQKFEELELEKNNLVVANYSLPFCNKNCFEKLWKKIISSIATDGYFVGNFFRIK